MPPRLARLPSVALPGGVRVCVAAGSRARLIGLAGLRASALERGCALLLTPCASVHTAGMRFALDLMWLSSAGVLVRVDRGVAPWRLRACRGARAVIEARAGDGDVVVAALEAEGARVQGLVMAAGAR